MFYPSFAAHAPGHKKGKNHRPKLPNLLMVNLCLGLALCAAAPPVRALAQTIERDINAPAKPEVSVKNRNGRVRVVAAADRQGKISIKAESPGAAVLEADVVTKTDGNRVTVDVRARRERDRIDLTVRVPERSKVYVETEAGAVDVIGNVASASVATNTGTILGNVPLDSVNYNFLWQASRPRFFSDVELPAVKEKAGGWYSISGRIGDKKAEKELRVRLDFSTQRGVILFNVDPSMVPPDLKERPLTEAARAIVRSGDVALVEAVRKVAPRMFGEYAQTLPPPKDAPTLVARRPPTEVATSVAPQLMRLNASVTDRSGRAISGLGLSDFALFENGKERQITEVAPTSAPFNLVLLLDVSGSVEERIDFIRKAARNFLATVGSQDRIAIISFREDIQVISDFTTDRALLSARLDQIAAGGPTALYDALAYTLVEQLKQLRGERTAVVILSDGDDNKSFVPFETLIESVYESGALIYPLYIPSGLIPESSAPAPSVTLDPLRTRYLTLTTRAEDEGRRLATVSGGIYYPIRHLDDLQRAYDDVVAQLRMAYTITYTSSADAARERRIRVRANREGAAVRLSPAVSIGASVPKDEAGRR
ncbi:MAG TPA: VWA domain-containing protein [Pyrinomonadaceae bacterium]|jgi:VWFA-related protein|nr:VWA domain-containing protein [Pyrinomonadaceae bacterium]